VSVLAVIPARRGSKGVPRKNLVEFGGLPLVAHSIRCAQLCPEVARIVVTTDSEEIAEVARDFGADVPFLRPADLAQDDTPMWPVLRHALEAADPGRAHDILLLLDPTSPGRLPTDVSAALGRLAAHPEADGVVGVSRPHFNPIWHAVVEHNGYLAQLIPSGAVYGRRQDVPAVYRINATLYAWRTAFVLGAAGGWQEGRNLLHELPELRSFHIDEPEDLAVAAALLDAGLVALPWL
jgi:N-acylneuraminate cytidylyltransferase